MKRGTSSFLLEIMPVTLRKLKPCHTRLGNQNQEWKNTKCPHMLIASLIAEKLITLPGILKDCQESKGIFAFLKGGYRKFSYSSIGLVRYNI